MNKIIFLTFIINSLLCTRNSNSNSGSLNNSLTNSYNSDQSGHLSSSQVFKQPQVLYQIFGTLSNDNKKINYLSKPIPAYKELKNFCPNIQTTKCSKSLVTSITESMADTYNTMKIIREQIKQIDAQAHQMQNSMRVYRYMTEEILYYREFQECLNLSQDENFNAEQFVKNSLEEAKKFKHLQGKGLLLFNDLRKQLVEYYGGIFCGLCNHGMKDFSYEYKDDYYDYLVIQFNQKTKVKLIDMLKKINDLQKYLHTIAQVTKVANCYYGQLRQLDAFSYFDLYQNAGSYHQEINDGLELCKTSQSIDNFLNQGDMDCATLLSYTGPFANIDYFEPLGKSFEYIIKSFNYINLQKESKVIQEYKDDKGTMVNYSFLSKEIQLLKRPEESKQLYQDFQQTGIDVVQQKFLYESLRTLAKRNRPGMFAFMKFRLL